MRNFSFTPRRFLDHEGVVTSFALVLLLLSTFVQAQTPVVLAPVPQLTVIRPDRASPRPLVASSPTRWPPSYRHQ
jgi:hypothetical protein